MSTTIKTKFSEILAADVLIITVTREEGLSVINVFEKATGIKSEIVTIKERGYHYFGKINDATIFMAVSRMGAGVPGGSNETVRKGIEALNPGSVIMVGIAFGLKKGKQSIGDVLISDQILAYDLQRVGRDKNLSRGDKVTASPKLLNLLKTADLSRPTDKPNVEFGVILCGEKLIDNLEFRNELAQFSPEAIGGEMEGNGLYLACQEKKVDWVLIKAICDWADGNKSKNKKSNQQLAANNAAQFTLHALQVTSHKRSESPDEDAPQDRGQNQELMRLLIEQSNRLNKVTDIPSKLEIAEITSNFKYSQELVDEEIQKQLKILIQSRFFLGSLAESTAFDLAREIKSGKFSNGSSPIRSRALAWCVRILSSKENDAKCTEYLHIARQLGNSEEIAIAEAFVIATNSKIEDALFKLSHLSSPAVRSAALFILFKHKNDDFALEWMTKAALTILDLDADGKGILIQRLLHLDRWEQAYECSNKITNDDYLDAPILFFFSAISKLSMTISLELRSSAMMAVPFEVDNFPLASTESALLNRRNARQLFLQCANAARNLGREESAKVSEDYALWLSLRDPVTKETGLDQLESSMRDPQYSLRRLHFAIRFNIRLDISAVEQEIDRVTAMTGGKSVEAAIARFSLILVQQNAAEVVRYINNHRSQLQAHVDKQLIQKIEIEALARGGFHKEAEELLTKHIAEGFNDDVPNLNRILLNEKGVDPKVAYITAFELSNRINDLENLVQFLEGQGDWPMVCQFGAILFERTNALIDAERLGCALDSTKRYAELLIFLTKYPEFLEQSD